MREMWWNNACTYTWMPRFMTFLKTCIWIWVP
jgi:hypothetical protein